MFNNHHKLIKLTKFMIKMSLAIPQEQILKNRKKKLKNNSVTLIIKVACD